MDAELIRRDNEWDYVRHIMAPWCGGDPKKIMKLKRDEIIVTEDQLNKVKEMLERYKRMKW